jgi:uncharacterized protein YdaU (DUF1376 family)
MHYYQHHIGDFIKDTTHLDDHQLATYLRMLWSYYTSESPISGDFEDVAFAMRTDEKTVRLLMRHFFTETPDGWHHTRCDKEIAEYHSKAEKARNSANARWKNADAMRTHSERNSNAMVFDANQEPITNNHKPVKEKATVVATPHGVSDSVWQDFVKHRKAKKAQVTQTVIDGIQREADKAGWPLDAALRECITRNWQSFKADWVADKNLSQTGQMNQRVASGLTRGLIGGDNHVNLLGN